MSKPKNNFIDQIKTRMEVIRGKMAPPIPPDKSPMKPTVILPINFPRKMPVVRRGDNLRARPLNIFASMFVREEKL